MASDIIPRPRVPWAQAEVDRLYNRYLELNARRDQLADAAIAGDPTAVAQIQQINREIKSLVLEWERLEGSPASSGDDAANSAIGRGDNATVTDPPAPPKIIFGDGRIAAPPSGAGTNATPTETSENNPTTGTDAPLRPLNQTQAINNQSNTGGGTGGGTGSGTGGGTGGTGTGPGTGGGGTITNTGGPGAGARGDDGTPTSPSVVANRLDALYAAKNNFINERPNLLNDYVNYTYSLSWYIVDPRAYNQTIQNIKANLNGYYLLAQSGGITSGNEQQQQPQRMMWQDDPVIPTSTPTRSPYFNLDYYLDELRIETAYPATLESGGPVAFKNISFTVSEPNGVTLPLNLYRAVNELYKQTEQAVNIGDPGNFINYASGMYCMVIRFYGYDDNGNLVQPITNNVSSTDPRAAVEKFIFYQQNSLTYSVGSKLTQYKITGSVPSARIGYSTDRGSIPYNMQFTGSTVKDVLVGQIKQQTASQAAGDNTRNGKPIASAPPATPTPPVVAETNNLPVFDAGSGGDW